MTTRSLSKREGDLILALEWEKKPIITVREIVKRLRCSQAYALFMTHQLHKKGWLTPISKGVYQLVGADRGPKGVPQMNPYVAARYFPKPNYFAYGWALEKHGLSTQMPTTYQIAVMRRKSPLELKNVRFEFIVLTRKRFFGYESTRVFEETIQVSDLERTVLDALDRTDLCGGIEAATLAVFQSAKKLNYAKLLEYLTRFDDSVLARRFGYIAEQLKIKLPKKLMAYLETRVTKDAAFLDSPKRWGVQGTRDRKWNLVINVTREELFGEVHIG